MDAEEDYGLIRPSLIKTLKCILDQYPDDGQILKEIIQNAEDAGARVVKFLYDEREYPTEKLHHPEMARFQDPALLAYNDAQFKEEDWRGIRMLQDSVKVKDNMKVGKFGLGFKSVLHLTDLPSVLSGELLQMIDPHEEYFTYNGEKSTGYRWSLIEKREEMNRISDQFRPYQNVFGCTEEHFREGSFPGTIFRFPLRTEATCLSETIYTRSKIEELFDNFIPHAEKILLFLKSVERIELLTCGKDEKEAKLYFSVSIKENCLENVKTKRVEFYSNIKESERQNVSVDYPIAIETIVYDDGIEKKRHTFVFLINEYYAGLESSITFKETEIDFFPLVGTALPVKDRTTEQTGCTHDYDHENAVGQLFCFLPLPVEQKSSTGLPVHVNGFFAISQNRRHLKWPTIGSSFESDKELVWNHFLLNKALPRSYVDLIKRAIKVCKKNPNWMLPEDVFNALPNINLVDEKWNCLMERFYETAVTMKIFYTRSSRRKWLHLSDCVIDLLPGPGSDVDAVTDYLISVDVPVCRPPKFVGLAIDRFTDKRFHKQVDPFFVCQILKEKDDYKLRSPAVKLALLAYVLDVNRYEDLRGLQLLPVADGTFVQFEKRKKKDNIVFVCNDTCHKGLLPGKENQLLAAVADESVMKRLENVMTSGKCNLVKLDAKSILVFIKDIIPAEWIGAPTIIMNRNSHPLSYEWLRDVWVFLRAHYPSDLRVVSNLPLLPIAIRKKNKGENDEEEDRKSEHSFLMDEAVDDDTEVILAPLLQPSNIISVSVFGTELTEEAAELLDEIQGIHVVRSLPEFVTAHSEVRGKYVRLAVASDVLDILQEADKSSSQGKSTNLREVLQKASCKKIDSMIQILVRTFENNVSSKARKFMRSLPLFTSTTSEGRKVSIDEVKKACPENDFPVELDEPYLVLRTIDQRQLAEELHVELITKTSLFYDKILPKMRQRLTVDETQAIMNRVFEDFSTYAKEDPAIFDRLADVPFVVTGNDQLMNPNELFDPENQILCHMFVQQNVFPSGGYANSERLILLRKMQLKCEKNVTPKDLLDAAACTEELLAKDSECITQKSKALLDFIISHPNILHEPINGQKLSKLLSDIRWMPVARNRVSSFPQSLPWAGEAKILEKPSEMCIYHLSFIGSCRLLCCNDIPEKVRYDLGLISKPKVTWLVSQLKHIVDNYQMDEKANIMTQLSSVYNGMDEYSDTELCDAFTDFKLKDWVWNGDGFSTVEYVFIQVPFDIRPYAYPLPSEMHRFRIFFERCGVSSTINVAGLLKVLERIRDAHCQGESSEPCDVEDPQDINVECSGEEIEKEWNVYRNLNKPDVARDLQLAIHILNTLSDRITDITEEQRQAILLPIKPIKDGDIRLIFKPLSDVTYCDIEWLQKGYDTLQLDEESDNIFYMHERVPLVIANTLRVPTLISRMLSASELDIAGFGQSESLTHRLKQLLDDYADGLSIPKELIQNADDAEATEVAFLYDERNLEDQQEYLIDEGMKACQGPALWVHNNAVFTETDFEAIIKLGGATKEKQHNKIGQFGLGFNAVYNVTDVPSFVSRNSLVIFDPNMYHLGRAVRGGFKPGIKIDIRKNKSLLRRIPHQFSPYEDIFDCRINNGEEYQGTLFRLPLRTEAQAKRSNISNRAYNKQEVLTLFKVAVDNIHNLLLFTQNVTTVRFYHLNNANTNEMRLMFEITKEPVRIIRELSFAKGIPHHVNKIDGIDTAKRKLIKNSNFLSAASQFVALYAKETKISPKHISPPRSTLLIRTVFLVQPKACSMIAGVDWENISSAKYWLLASCLSTNSSWLFGKEHGDRYLSIGGVAMELKPVKAGEKSADTSNEIMAFEPRTDLCGTVFCHLPLPILSELPVHVNAAFAIARSRRFLVSSNQDDTDKTNAEWNKVVFGDSVAQAYIQILVDLKEIASATSKPSFGFFKMWPNPPSYFQEPYKSLCVGFYNLLTTSDNTPISLRYDGLCQLRFSFFIDVSRSQFGSEKIISAAVKAFESCDVGNKFVEMPSKYLRAFEDTGCKQFISEKRITLLRFCKEVFFPNIKKFDKTVRETLILHILAKTQEDNKEATELREMVEKTACIPVEPDGTFLKHPSELVQPASLVACMYDIEDHRFPISALNSSYKVLRNLGMANTLTSWENIEERAQTVEGKYQMSLDTGSKRLRSVLDVLDKKIARCLTSFSALSSSNNSETEKQRTMLKKWGSRFRMIRCLPTIEKPDEFPIDWFGENKSQAISKDTCQEYSKVVQSSSRDKQEASISPKLLSVDESFPREKIFLVSSTQHVVDSSLLTPRIMTFLYLNEKQPTLAQVLHQAKMAFKLDVSKLNEKARNILDKMMMHIYEFLENACNNNEQNEMTVRAAFDSTPCIFVGGYFAQPQNVAFYFSRESQCIPYLYMVNEYWKKFKIIYKTLGVKNAFLYGDYVRTLKKIKELNDQNPVDEKHIQICCTIAGCLRDNMKMEGNKYTDVEKECGPIYLPDEKCVLQPSSNLCLNESNFPGLHFTSMTHVHGGLPNETALVLGVKQERAMLLRNCAVPFGQTQSIVTGIKRVIDQYSEHEIFKELIQNADDAGATEMCFVLDPRQHKTEDIFDKHWAPLQGAALLVHNNATFTDSDLYSIQHFGVGNKKQDAFKTGQYGVGFASVYHITDAPCLLTTTPEKGSVFACFDPMCLYTGTEREPGLLVPGVERMWKTFCDTFDCFLPKDLEHTTGSTFRFPLRTIKMAKTSKISTEEVTVDKIRHLLNQLSDNLFDIILFTKSLRKVRICVMNEITNQMDSLYTAESKIQEEEIIHNLVENMKEGARLLQGPGVLLQCVPVRDMVYRLTLVDSSKQEEDWCVSHRIGLDKKAQVPSSIAEALLKRDLCLLPYGSTAVCLSRKQNQRIVKERRTSRLFCYFPLPQKTNLPVHVNGHFALNSEARKMLNEGDTGYRKDWNELLMTEIVAPSYLNLLNTIRFECLNKIPHTGDGEGPIWSTSYDTLESALLSYQNNFPTVNQVQNQPLLETMFGSFYKKMDSNEYCILPCICEKRTANETRKHLDKTDQNKENDQYKVRWFPPSGKGDKRAYFCKKHSEGTEFDILKRVLFECGVNILSVSQELITCFENAAIAITIVSPETVLKFFQSFGTSEKWCNVGPVPCRVKKSMFQNAKTVRMVLKYCKKTGDNFLTLLSGTPLLLTNNETLMQFDRDRPVFCTESVNVGLIPECANEFLHMSLRTDVFKETDISSNPYLKRFKITDLADRLEHHIDKNTYFQKSRTKHSGVIPWDDDKKLRKDWLEKLWKYIKSELTGKDKPPLEEAHVIQELACLKGWAIIPVIVDDRHCLSRLENASNIFHHLYLSFDANPHYRDAQDALVKLKQPRLSSSPISTDVMVLEPLMAQVNRPETILCFLSNVPKEAFKTFNECDKYTLLRYFVDSLLTLKRHGNSKEWLAKLPLYKTVYDDFIKISNCFVYIVPGDIPTTGIESWQNHEGIVFLKENDKLQRLHEFLGCKTLSCVQVYCDFIFQHFEMFEASDRAVHIRHVYQNYVQNSSNTLPSFDQQIFKKTIKDLSFIEDDSGVLQPPSAFFDPTNEVFKVMTEEIVFPPKTPEGFKDEDWYDMLRNLGMVQTVTFELFEDFVSKVEENPTSHNIEEKSKVLVEHLFNMDKEELKYVIPKIYQRRFIVPYRFDQSYQELAPLYPDAIPGKLIAFQHSICQMYATVAWSSACILPNWANPRKINGASDNEIDTYLTLLGVCPKPSPEIVASHLQNVCVLSPLKEPTQVTHNVLEVCLRKIFGYFNKLDYDWVAQYPEVHSRLYNLPCINVAKGRKPRFVCANQCQFNLSEEEEILPYLYRLPPTLGEFKEFFQTIGGTKLPTAEHYASVLKKLNVDRPLNPNQLRAALKSIRGLFTALQKGNNLKKDTTLYMLSEKQELVDVRNLVYNDSPAYYYRVLDFNLRFLMRPRDCGVCSLTGEDVINLLPTDCQPRRLSSLITECILPDLTITKEGFAEELESKLRSDAFRHSLARLTRHFALQCEMELSEKELMQQLENLERLEVYSVQQLKTHLMYQWKIIPDSDSKKVCFVQRNVRTLENGEIKHSAKIYLKDDDIANAKLFVPLAEVIIALIPALQRQSVPYLLALLSCSCDQMKDTLDSYNIAEVNSQLGSKVSRQTTLFPSLGTPITEVHGRSLTKLDTKDDVTLAAGDWVGYQETPASTVVYCRVETVESTKPVTVFLEENKASVQAMDSQLFVFEE